MSHVISSQPSSTSPYKPTGTDIDDLPTTIITGESRKRRECCCDVDDNDGCCLSIFCQTFGRCGRLIGDCTELFCESFANCLNNCCEDKPKDRGRRYNDYHYEDTGFNGNPVTDNSWLVGIASNDRDENVVDSNNDVQIISHDVASTVNACLGTKMENDVGSYINSTSAADSTDRYGNSVVQIISHDVASMVNICVGNKQENDVGTNMNIYSRGDEGPSATESYLTNVADPIHAGRDSVVQNISHDVVSTVNACVGSRQESDVGSDMNTHSRGDDGPSVVESYSVSVESSSGWGGDSGGGGDYGGGDTGGGGYD